MKTNLISSVEKYLRRNKERPVLQYVQTLHDKQVILDGYTMFIFDKHNEDLDSLEEIPEKLKNNQYDYEKLIQKCEYEDASEDFKFILKNINKIISYANSKNYKLEDKFIPIFYNNSIYDAYRFRDVFNIMQDFDNLKIMKHSDSKLWYHPLYLKNDKITSVIYPLRYNEENKEMSINFTNEVLESLNQNNKYELF